MQGTTCLPGCQRVSAASPGCILLLLLLQKGLLPHLSHFSPFLHPLLPSLPLPFPTLPSPLSLPVSLLPFPAMERS